MLNYVKKFTMEILPSVAATIIGAYIVNHYIVTKPAADAPAAAAISAAGPKGDTKTASESKPAEASAVGNLPAVGVKAKGMSERTLLERSAAEKATVIEKPQEKLDTKSAGAKPADIKPADTKSADTKSVDTKVADTKPADAPVETAGTSAEPRRHTPAPRDKIRVVLPSPVQPTAAAPVAAVPSPAAPVEAAAAPDEHRDANDLARAAIERLRGSGDNAPRPQEAARAPDASRAPETPRVTAPAIRPLPPPIMVSAPPNEPFDQGSSQAKPSYPANAGIGDPRRPTPPADIPLSRPPLDLRADAEPPAPREHTSVADDVLSAAKSVFHAVLPK